LINPGTDEFYQDCREEILKIVAKISADYRETIHYGYSQGATGALDIGLSDPKCSAIFAMSPHLVLDRPWSRSAVLMSPGTLAQPRENMLDRIRSSTNRDIHLFISCMDSEDGVQVRDARTLADTDAHIYFLNLMHDLPGVHNPEGVIQDYLATRKYTLPPGVVIASEQDQKVAMLSFDVRAAGSGKTELPAALLAEAEVLHYSGLAYWLGQYFTGRKEYNLALLHFMRSIAIGRQRGTDIYSRLVCAGNVASVMGLSEMALGFYRQARRIWPKALTAWNCEANVLRSLKRKSELLTLAEQCAAAGCDADTVEKIKKRAEGL
jgi:tetratricopeptide (TPR) repeat protein